MQAKNLFFSLPWELTKDILSASTKKTPDANNVALTCSLFHKHTLTDRMGAKLAAWVTAGQRLCTNDIEKIS